MKNLLFAILATFLFISCNDAKIKTVSNKDVFLKKGQMFYHKFGTYTITFIVKDYNENGYYCTATDWLWDATEFISKKELNDDIQFKAIGMYPAYGKKPNKRLPNELSKLKVGDKFQMVVSGQLESFIVFARDTSSIMVKDPRFTIQEWSMNIPFSNYNPHFFKKLTK